MPKPLWDQRVPFTKGRMAVGSQLRGNPRNLCWLNNHVFKATLELQEGFDSGSSSEARRLWFVNVDTGEHYCMFVKELFNALKCSRVDGCRFTGTWTFKKCGQNYSITAVEEKRQ